MARIIDFRPEEQQERCHHCNSLIGYVPGEEQVDYSPWIFSRKYEPYYFKKTDIIKTRFKQYFIICPNCGKKIYLPHTKEEVKTRTIEGKYEAKKVKIKRKK